MHTWKRKSQFGSHSSLNFLQLCGRYLPLTCNQGKAGCMPCIGVMCEESVENLIDTDILNFLLAHIVVHHRFEEAKINFQ